MIAELRAVDHLLSPSPWIVTRRIQRIIPELVSLLAALDAPLASF
jgi:hypothetical protein